MKDLISRQWLVECMDEGWIKFDTEKDENRFIHLVRDIAPSAQPEQRWIPVTERLPDELAEVNVTWENTEPEPYYDFVKGHCFTGTAVYFCGRWYWYSAVCVDYLREYGFSPNDEMDDAIKVHAWMPLPEPYREEEQDATD